ncbi:MAG: cobalt ECF transporter T component CbiQ [Chloroflexi bacterium]|nr:cobalt ECF transporter T component CbiQ [Chloroflexota bacterium]
MKHCDCVDVSGLNTGSSFLCRVEVRAKMIAVFVTLAIILTSPYLVTSLLLAAAALAILLKIGLKGRQLWQRLLVPAYMTALVIVTQTFWTGSSIIFSVGPFAARWEGLAQGLLIASRVAAGNLVILALAATTSPMGLLSAARWLRLPDVLVELAALIYRYMFLLLEEARTLRQAQQLRLGYHNWKKALNSTSTLFALVLVRTYDRASRVYEAMAVRGYTGDMPAPEKGRGKGYISQAVALSVLPGLCWLGGYLRIWPF